MLPPSTGSGWQTPLEQPRILVVDDEPDVLRLIVDWLKEEGHVPRSTGDSREAARLLEAGSFDILVSDIRMPDPDGLALLEAARRRNPRVQVLLITGYASRPVALEALEKGASGFIEKPLSRETLLQAVRQAVLRWSLTQPQTDTG